MRKIGLLNVQNVDNYGANLIAFAMEKEVKKIVDERDSVQTINFCPDQKVTANKACSVINCYYQGGIKASLRQIRREMLKSASAAAHKIGIPQSLRGAGHKFFYKEGGNSGVGSYEKYVPTREEEEQRKMSFSNFRSAYLNCSASYSDASFTEQRFDIIIVGSDVVWKPQRLLVSTERNGYFLSLDHSCRKIAYAASIGSSDKKLLERLKRKYRKEIGRFDYISMREESAQKYVAELFESKEVFHCIDPTFFLSYADCLKLAEAANVKQETSYIYVYVLGDNADAIAFAKQLAQEKGLSVFYHSKSKFDNNAVSVYSDGPQEFIYRILNASYVVTDSFHGTVFSIIMRKQFYTFTRGKLSIRLEELVKKLGIEDRLIDHFDETLSIDNIIHYKHVEKIIQKWVYDSEQFLKTALKE